MCSVTSNERRRAGEGARVTREGRGGAPSLFNPMSPPSPVRRLAGAGRTAGHCGRQGGAFATGWSGRLVYELDSDREVVATRLSTLASLSVTSHCAKPTSERHGTSNSVLSQNPAIGAGSGDSPPRFSCVSAASTSPQRDTELPGAGTAWAPTPTFCWTCYTHRLVAGVHSLLAALPSPVQALTP